MTFPNYFHSSDLFKAICYDILSLHHATFLSPLYRNACKNWAPLRAHDTAVIIANGPSFNDSCCEIVAQYQHGIDVFAMCYFACSQFANKISPRFYILSDPEVLQPLTKKIDQRNREVFKYLDDNRSTIVLVPSHERWNCFRSPCFKFNDSQSLILAQTHPSLPRGYTSNTAFKAIAIAKNMGYRRVLILGLDYSYPRMISLQQDRTIALQDIHFYGSESYPIPHWFDSVAHALLFWSLDYQFSRRLAGPGISNISETTLLDAFPLVHPRHLRDCLETAVI